MTSSPLRKTRASPADAPSPKAGAQAAHGRVAAAPAVDQVDSGFLETLIGYNARRAALAVIDVFMVRMAAYELKPVDFSVLSLITHNPGITSRQLCTALGILPPNLVGVINALERRKLITRQPHPRDGRALGLHATGPGRKLMREAESAAAQLESDATSRLSAAERSTLIRLLKKIYL